MNDYAAIRKLFAISPPGPAADAEAFEQYVHAVSQAAGRLAVPTFIGGLSPYSAQSLLWRYVSYGPADVDMEVSAGPPPGVFEALRGRFDPTATDEALAKCEGCPDAHRQRYKREVYLETPIHSWGDGDMLDFMLRLAPPVFDQFGRTKPLAVQKEYVFRQSSVEGLKFMLAAQERRRLQLAELFPVQEGEGYSETADNGGVVQELLERLEREGYRGSLADVPEYWLLAEGLTRLGAYSAFISDQSFSLDNYPSSVLEGLPADQVQRLKQQLATGPVLRPFQTLATGIGKDDSGRYMAVVLVHATEEAATDNVELLRMRIKETGSLFTGGRPWREMIETMEIRSEGRVLLAKVRGDRIAGAWIGILYNFEPLFLHE